MHLSFEKTQIYFFGGVILLSALIVIIFGMQQKAVSSCTNSSVALGEATFTVTIADTPASLERGLSGSAMLPNESGMLFMFDKPARYEFWMKEMNFPLDIIWIGENWNVVGIVASATPESFPETFVSPTSTRYVLEVNSGVAETLGLQIGSPVRFLFCPDKK